MIPQVKVETKYYALILPVEYAICNGTCHILHTPSKRVLCIGMEPALYESLPFLNGNPKQVREMAPIYLMGDPKPRWFAKSKRYTVCEECRRVAESMY